jgi:hypothetical protein
MKTDPRIKWRDMTFNIIRHRGDPTTATLASGDIVKKEPFLFFQDQDGIWRKVKCADYHGEHFIFLDPEWLKGKIGRWFAMCTCGSAAVMISPKDARGHESEIAEQLLVCYVYQDTLTNYGTGMHATKSRKWW